MAHVNDLAFIAWYDTSETINKIKFLMIGDSNGTICRNFDVMIEEELALRSAFVINPDGVIKAYEIHDLGNGRSAAEVSRKLHAAQFVGEDGGKVCPASWNPDKESLTPSLELVVKI